MDPINLTEEQRKYIDDNYESTPDLIALTKAAFMDESLDGRSREGRAVREYMASKDYKYKTTKVEKVKGVNLTKDQKEFITHNADAGMKAFEIATLLFQDNATH